MCAVEAHKYAVCACRKDFTKTSRNVDEKFRKNLASRCVLCYFKTRFAFGPEAG